MLSVQSYYSMGVMSSFSTVIIFFIISWKFTDQFEILVVAPHFGKSHFLVYKLLFEKLATIGHEVTVVSHFPREQPLKNYRDIDLTDGWKLPTENLRIDEFTHSRIEKYGGANQLAMFANINCPRGLSSKNLQAFIKEEHHFDLIIIEIFNTNCFYSLAKRFNAPIVAFSTSSVIPWMHLLFGFPEIPSYNPSIFLDLPDRMNFLQRVENTLFLIYNNLVFKYLLTNPGYEYAKKYVGIDMRQGVDPLYNISLALMNTHFTLIRPRPFTPNIIEVGGIHIAPDKTLPQKIDKFINESADGVIYVSMGSMMKGHTFPKEKRDAFLRAFSKMPQRVIWKWENDTMDGNPKNLLTVKWAPQKDILCHPNVKVFVSHGGLLGTLEAVHCGIPVILMPHYGDQHSNAQALVAAGSGVLLHFPSITDEKILDALRTTLSPNYQAQAKSLSEKFRDRPLSPMDTAIYWIEYVARYKGAKHMITTAVELPLYQYYLLDVFVFIFIIIATIFFIILLILKKLTSVLFHSEKKQKKQKRS